MPSATDWPRVKSSLPVYGRASPGQTTFTLLSSAYSPLSWLLVGSYFAGVVAASAPEAALVRIAALFPLTAPMVMPVRIAVGDVPAWEHALAIAIMLASTYAVIRLAGSVYSGALLRSGARPGFRAVWRAVRTG